MPQVIQSLWFLSKKSDQIAPKPTWGCLVLVEVWVVSGVPVQPPLSVYDCPPDPPVAAPQGRWEYILMDVSRKGPRYLLV